MGVGRSSVQDAKAVEESGDEALKEEVFEGKTSLKEGAKKARQKKAPSHSRARRPTKPSRPPPTLSDEERAESRQELGWGEVESGARMINLAAKHNDPDELVQGIKLDGLALHKAHEQIERAHTFLAQIEAMMAEKLRSSSTLQ